MTRLIRTTLSAVIICVGFILPEFVFAHAHLKNAVPEQKSQITQNQVPEAISLEFSENIETAMSKIAVHEGSETGPIVNEGKVLSPDGKKNVIEIALKRPLKSGVYFVLWKAVSVDTHKMNGKYQFVVK